MSIEVQLRRGTSSQNSAFTGAVGELVYTTDTKELFIHDGVTAGGSGAIITSAERTKLSGIAAGATVNSSDATLLDRANHTGTQTASTISDFDTEVANNTAVVANTAKVGLTNGSVDSNKLSTTLDFGLIA